MATDYRAQVTIAAQYTGQSAVAQAKKDIESTDKSAKALSNTLKGISAALIFREGVRFARSILEIGDSLNDLRQKTGIGVQALSSLKAAAEDSGLDFGGLETGLKKFSVKLSEAASGSREAQEAFKAIGVSIKDASGQIRPSEQVLADLADRFSKLQDGPQKAALAVKLFGKSGADIIPLLNEGREAVQGFGLAITDDFALRADQFNDTINELKRNAQQFGINVIGPLLPVLQELANAFVDLTKSSTGGSDTIQVFSDALRILGIAVGTLASVFVQGVDTIYTAFRQLGEDVAFIASNIADRFSTIAEQVQEAAKLNFDAVSKLEEDYEIRKAERRKFYTENTEKIEEEFLKRSTDRVKKIENLYNSLSKNLGNNAGAAADTKPVDNRRSSGGTLTLPEKPDRTEQTQADRLARFQADQEREIELLRQKTIAINTNSVEYRKNEEAIKLKAEAEKLSIGLSDENKKKVQELTQQYIEQKNAIIDLGEAQRQSFGRGAQQALDEYLDRASDVAAQSKQLFSNAFQGIEDALVKFVQTGKLSFADFAKQIEADLIRIAVRRALVFGITSAFGGAAAGAAFADGGVMTSSGPMPLKAYASGGIANSPQIALFGEGSKPEAFVPLPDGRSIPVTVSGEGGGGGNTNVVVNVSINGGGGTDQGTQGGQGDLSDSEKGRQLGRVISAAVKQTILDEKRPGGLLA